MDELRADELRRDQDYSRTLAKPHLAVTVDEPPPVLTAAPRAYPRALARTLETLSESRHRLFVSVTLAMICCFSVPFLLAGRYVLRSGPETWDAPCNALTTGVICGVAPLDLSHCSVNATFSARGETFVAVGLVVKGGNCVPEVVGTVLDLCYHWQDPGDGSAGTDTDHSFPMDAKSRMSLAVFFFVLAVVPLLVSVLVGVIGLE
jgi:hypothetical protein